MKIIGLVTALSLLVVGCGTPPPIPDVTITVFAAASLKEAFTTIGADFEDERPGMTVRFNFGASSTLAQNINQGAPADVFAAASPAAMKTVTAAGGEAVAAADGEPVVFARNRLQIAVPKGNPAKVTTLADFARPQLKIAVCATQVPCGAAAGTAFAAAGVTPRPDTLEQDVRATLTKVVLGEVDAALVYRTDVRAAGGTVEGIDFPEAAKAINDYPILPLSSGENGAAARDFIDFVLSPGQQVLSNAGFATP
jgi:molybdate transport system substrate-binding protein